LVDLRFLPHCAPTNAIGEPILGTNEAKPSRVKPGRISAVCVRPASPDIRPGCQPQGDSFGGFCRVARQRIVEKTSGFIRLHFYENHRDLPLFRDKV
jgi:hypothetical protein